MRSNWSSSVNSELKSTFPADWPEVEYLSEGGEAGFQENFIKDAPHDGYNYGTVAIALVAPLSRGTVSISSSDMSDPPVINPNWLTHPADVDVVVAGYKRVRQMFATSAVKPLLIGEEYFPGKNVSTDAQILDIIRRSMGTVFHASATCKMGRANDTMAVVDSHARVFGVQGLRVVDASAFALLPPGHPMSTICKYLPPVWVNDQILTGCQMLLPKKLQTTSRRACNCRSDFECIISTSYVQIHLLCSLTLQ